AAHSTAYPSPPSRSRSISRTIASSSTTMTHRCAASVNPLLKGFPCHDSSSACSSACARSGGAGDRNQRGKWRSSLSLRPPTLSTPPHAPPIPACPLLSSLLSNGHQIFVSDLSDLVVPEVEGGRVGVRADQVRCQQPLQALEGRLHGPAHSSLQHLEGEAAPDHRRALQQLA